MVPCAPRARRMAASLVCLAGCAASSGAAPDAAPPPAVDAELSAPPDVRHDPPPPRDSAPAVTDAGLDEGAPADGPASLPFAPCPPGIACRILPLGDSLTFGVGSAGAGGGYRVPLFRRVLADKKAITFVGSQSNGPETVDGAPFPRGHEGYRGYAIAPGGGREGLAPVADHVVRDARPHIVLLLAGTNDVGATVIDPARAPERLGALIDLVVTAAPDALVVVAQIPPSMTDAVNQRIEAFDQALPAVVEARVRAGRHVLLIDAYAALATRPDYKRTLMFNEFHPNDAGYALIADRWYQAVIPFLR
jgi:lysophospholipase L1-like esterase